MDCCVRFVSSVVSRTIVALCVEGCLSIKAEKGSLIFGVISALLTGVSSVITLVLLLLVNCLDWEGEEIVFGHHKVIITTKLIIVINIILCVLAVKLLIDFIFAVLLCDGICKKKPHQVRSYYIYGLVMVFLKGLMVIFAFWVQDWECAITMLMFLMLYYMILHMVKVAHTKMTTGEVYQFQHKQLVEMSY